MQLYTLLLVGKNDVVVLQEVEPGISTSIQPNFGVVCRKWQAASAGESSQGWKGSRAGSYYGHGEE